MEKNVNTYVIKNSSGLNSIHHKYFKLRSLIHVLQDYILNEQVMDIHLRKYVKLRSIWRPILNFFKRDGVHVDEFFLFQTKNNVIRYSS